MIPQSSNPNPHSLALKAAETIANATGLGCHDIALTLGSGWGKTGDHLGETRVTLPAGTVPGFSSSGVPGHSGTIRSVALPNGKRALLIGARTHYYEAKGVRAVVHSVRTAAACGAKVMILTNGAGGIKDAWSPGQPVLIADHINLTGTSPLEGGTFLDLTDLYSQRLRALAKVINPALDEGVYVQFRGHTMRLRPKFRWSRLWEGT